MERRASECGRALREAEAATARAQAECDASTRRCAEVGAEADAARSQVEQLEKAALRSSQKISELECVARRLISWFLAPLLLRSAGNLAVCCRRRVAEMGTQASHFEDRARAAQQQAHREAAAKASEAAAGMRSELGEREATISELQREVRTHHSSAVTCLKKSLTGGCGARWPSCVRQGNRTRRSMRR